MGQHGHHGHGPNIREIGPFAGGILVSFVSEQDCSIFPGWLKIAETYSASKLTKQTDKLTAIKGLMQAYVDALRYKARDECHSLWNPAMRANAMLGSWSDFNRPVAYRVTPEYSYSIWLANLAKQRLWWKSTASIVEYGEVSAPSWSWMALKSSITYLKFTLCHGSNGRDRRTGEIRQNTVDRGKKEAWRHAIGITGRSIGEDKFSRAVNEQELELSARPLFRHAFTTARGEDPPCSERQPR